MPAIDRAMVVFQNDPELVLLTHAWKFMFNADTDECELYAKPDDLWEVNDVSQRCPNEVRLFRELAEEVLKDQGGTGKDGWRLPEDLVTRHG